jgi:hypothetical protein
MYAYVEWMSITSVKLGRGHGFIFTQATQTNSYTFSFPLS